MKNDIDTELNHQFEKINEVILPKLNNIINKQKKNHSDLEYYINNFISEDILEFLKKIKNEIFDLVITSPPYNKQEKNNGGLVKKIIYDDYKDIMKETEYQSWQIKVLNELYRTTKCGGSFFYNHRVRYENGGIIHPLEWLNKTDWKVRQEIIWNRSIAGNIRGWRFWPIEERIYWLYKPKTKKDNGEELKSKHALLTSIWNIRPEMKNKQHPAPFPIEIPARIIYSLFDQEKNKLIIDPFGGSGTTAIASKLLNHNFVSIDISEKYNSIAKERIKNINDFKNIIDKEINQHFVKKTYKERKKIN